MHDNVKRPERASFFVLLHALLRQSINPLAEYQILPIV